jgi:hypothetical protein
MGGVYASETWLQVVMITGVIGGGAAALAGRAIAATWRPAWHVAGYMLLLGAGVRFLHFALFQGNILSLPSYVADTAYLILVSGIAFRATRAAQIVRQYPWLYARTGALTWRELPTQPEKSS